MRLSVNSNRITSTIKEGIMGSKGRHNEKKPKQSNMKKEEATKATK
jgi:hypothetical protein